MQEISTTKCSQCGTSIQRPTAERNGGICGPCLNKHPEHGKLGEMKSDLLKRIGPTVADYQDFDDFDDWESAGLDERWLDAIQTLVDKRTCDEHGKAEITVVRVGSTKQDNLDWRFDGVCCQAMQNKIDAVIDGFYLSD